VGGGERGKDTREEMRTYACSGGHEPPKGTRCNFILDPEKPNMPLLGKGGAILPSLGEGKKSEKVSDAAGEKGKKRFLLFSWREGKKRSDRGHHLTR